MVSLGTDVWDISYYSLLAEVSHQYFFHKLHWWETTSTGKIGWLVYGFTKFWICYSDSSFSYKTLFKIYQEKCPPAIIILLMIFELSLCLWYLKSSVKMLFKISHVAWYLKSSIKVLFKVSRVACVLEEVSKGGGAVSILVSFHDSAGWSPEEIGLISELRTLIRSLVRNHLRSPFCPDFPMIHPFWSPEHKHPYFQAQTLAVVSAVIFSSPTLLPIARVRWSLDELQSWIHTQLPSGSKVVPSLEQLWLTARVLHWRWSEKQQHWLWKDFENPLQACPSCQPMLCSVFCLWAMPKAWFPELCEMFVAFCWTNMVDEGSAFLSASSGN